MTTTGPMPESYLDLAHGDSLIGPDRGPHRPIIGCGADGRR
jgi:hypothetical protein